ncbi:hypothetical protein F946_03145 [Acinetobacter johnsonii ANC 3681]|uniref:Uncharacterized protein n=1 Tax=Acinetobacter johnsonii ANC 3681 TaxID=1217662 RepID=N9BDY2_ACIJO|nr:hypothetical protein [Acinetobacter johnsonii]ENV71466.1 hypothetical protein F946_03145 [Acinetobacter johnsonii ANC 3681]
MNLDNLIKITTVLVALVPFIVWLDKGKRFTHRRKFYLSRLDAVKEYLDNYYNSDKEKIERDCAAQLLVGSEKVGHIEVDYVIANYPQRFFIVIEDVITARKLIKIETIEDKTTFVTHYTKSQLIKLMIFLAVSYFLSLVILYLNDMLVAILTWLPYVNPIPVNSSVYFLGFIFSLSLFILTISSIWIFFWSADAALNIYNKLNVEYRPEEPEIQTRASRSN